MRFPCCSVCQNKFSEDERCPLLLQCGHCFCRECLSKMFAASQDASLSCPRCRHVSTVGNSVYALKKNYTVLSIIQGGEDEEEDDDEEDEDDIEGNEAGHGDGTLVTVDSICCRKNSGVRSANAGSSCVNYSGSRNVEDGFKGRRIDLGVHKEVKLLKRMGEGSSRRAEVQTWAAVVSGGGCKHKMSVKKFVITDDMDVVWM